MPRPPIWRYGQIVIVLGLLDPQGRNPKDRACVVVSPSDENGPGQPIDVVAISTKLPTPLPGDHVLLPWQSPRHPRTGLNKPNAAICSWLVEVRTDQIERAIGSVPGRQMLEIQAALRAMRRPD